MHTNIVYILGNLFNKFMKPFFNVRGEGSIAFIMGIISGSPIGAKIAVDLRNKKICNKEECERLLSFTNNSGPLFIIGTIGILYFQNTIIGILLFITHILASISVGFIFRFWGKNSSSLSKSSSYKKNNNSNNRKKNKEKNSNISFSNLGEILSESISSAIKTIFLIGGFILLFSSIISIFKASGLLTICTNLVSPFFSFFDIDTSFISGLLTGILEITNGINYISSIACKKISINIIIISFLLGFGGISIFLQVWSIVSKSDLSIKPYIYGKILHGLIAALYTYLLISFFPIFNFDL